MKYLKLFEQLDWDDPFGEELSYDDRMNLDWKMKMGDKVEINGTDRYGNEIIKIGDIGVVRSTGAGSYGRFGYIWNEDNEVGSWYYEKDLLLIK